MGRLIREFDSTPTKQRRRATIALVALVVVVGVTCVVVPVASSIAGN